jgi:long-subunit fatty acid transport protein
MNRLRISVAVPALWLLLGVPAVGQLVIGQYEDEAPLRTWNIFGIASAPSAGMGGIQFARAWDSSVSLTNPALLLALPRYSATLSASEARASLFKYSLVNTGVVATSGNLTAVAWGADFGGFAVRFGGWAVSASTGILEHYGRPGITATDGTSSYELDMTQGGYLRDYHLALARRLTPHFSAGLGLNYVSGHLRREVLENYIAPGDTITITDEKGEGFKGFFLNGGVSWQPTDRLTGSVVLRTPYIKRADATSLLRYQAPAAGTDIRTDAAARNEYRQPWILGTGWSYRISAAWTVAADLTYFGWSHYKVTVFDEPLARAFRDVLRVAAGVEYLISGTLFHRPALIPVRAGVSSDPQPMTAPRSAYLSASLGTGLRLPSFAVDISGAYAREKGSGNSLSSGRIALTLTYFMDR